MTTKTVALSKASLFSLDVILPALAFSIPFLVAGPQLLTGTVVNTLLFLSASRASKKTAITTALLPSIGALLNGLVFGKFTPFLLYFLPFIWISNLILISIFQNNSRPVFGILSASIVKSLFLFIIAFVFFRLSVVPQIFLTAMGIFQLTTAVLGGFVYLLINKLVPLDK